LLSVEVGAHAVRKRPEYSGTARRATEVTSFH
jgi:hypothetical protein